TPNALDSELDSLPTHREEALALLDKASLRLEAIRILVAG
ncbi:hypothetical protein ACLBTZ_23860, partial [Pseudomonas aeruginosa]